MAVSSRLVAACTTAARRRAAAAAKSRRRAAAVDEARALRRREWSAASARQPRACTAAAAGSAARETDGGDGPACSARDSPALVVDTAVGTSCYSSLAGIISVRRRSFGGATEGRPAARTRALIRPRRRRRVDIAEQSHERPAADLEPLRR